MTYRPSQHPGPGPASVPASLAIDADKFPSLPTQKALLLIDFQNDFVTPDGAVPVRSADDAFVQRAAKLAAGFRNVGIVVWVQSQFQQPRRFAEGQQIITAQGGRISTSEAFLSSGAPACVQRGSHGWQLAEPLKEVVVPGRDMLLMKTHYSAFQGTKLIQFLRSRLVTSLYICGSLINVGVHATTVDAAAHGYSITLVDDCCGWSDKSRADAAVVSLVNVSGCEVVKARSIVPSLGPKDDEEKKSAPGVKERGKIGGRSGEKLVDKVWGKPGGKLGKKSGERSDKKSDEKSGEEAREKPKETLEKKEGKKEGGNSTEELGGKKSDETSEEKPDAKSGGKPGETPAKKHAEKPADKHTKPIVETLAGVAIEADEGNNGLGLDDDDDNLGVIEALKKKYTRRRGPRTPAEGFPRDDGEKAGDRVLRKAAPRPKAEREARSQDPVERTAKIRDIKEGMDKLSLAHDKKSSGKSGLEKGSSAADTKAQPGRGGAADSAASASCAASKQGSESHDGREDAGRDSKQRRVRDGGIKSVASKGPNPDSDSKTSDPSNTGEVASKAPQKPTFGTMEATTTNTKTDPAPTSSLVPPPGGTPATTSPSLEESEPLCEGDTKVFYDVLPPFLESNIFEKLKDEVDWQHMSHLGGEVPRLVAVQGTVSPDGSHPVYRHPADESPPLRPFSPTVSALSKVVEERLGHTVNHVLIQLYRGGRDYISEHSDKTLDIVPGSYVANLSLGAERTMVFRTKRPEKEPSYARDPAPGSEAVAAEDSEEVADKGDADTKESGKNGADKRGSKEGDGREGTPRQTQRVRLPHNSLLRMGLKTNAVWLHSIRRDGRLDSEKTSAELSFASERISLTFRKIGTFLDSKEEMIWGQGARGKSREEAGKVINGGEGGRGEAEGEAERMVRAFGVENRMGRGFDWGKWYGEGFDVLHMTEK